MIYVRLVNANEIGIRKGGKSKRAGSFLMVSKRCLDFLPELSPHIADDTFQIQYISPNNQNMGLVDYVWHNKALHEESSTRNEYRLYFNRELDGSNYIEPNDIVVMKRVVESNFDGIKLFLFKNKIDREYTLITDLIGSKTHALFDKINIPRIDNYQFCSDSLNANVAIDNFNNPKAYIHEIREEELDVITPSASSMIENLRSFGYSPEEAIADIVDNSISASALHIKIEMRWHGTDSYIAIFDDGTGMTEQELIQAMRPGSKNPSLARENNDLGRFGMGLKSAAFSLGKELTVISKKNHSESIRRWSLDFVAQSNKWKVLKDKKEGSLNTKNVDGEVGTTVVVENLDRLLGLDGSNNIITSDDFYRIAEQISFHLSLVFHKYIESGSVAISFNDRVLKPFDPHFGCRRDYLYKHESKNDNIEICSFIVPKENDLPIPTQRLVKRTRGFTQMQGIYIYRGNRLISYGGWLNLGRRQQMKINDDYALGRVIVELTNSEDRSWRIDIKKSTAHPPLSILPALNRAAETARKASTQQVSQLTSKTKVKESFEGLWSKSDKGVQVDRGNSVYRQLASDDEVGEKFIDYIKSLEKKLPL